MIERAIGNGDHAGVQLPEQGGVVIPQEVEDAASRAETGEDRPILHLQMRCNLAGKSEALPIKSPTILLAKALFFFLPVFFQEPLLFQKLDIPLE